MYNCEFLEELETCATTIDQAYVGSLIIQHLKCQWHTIGLPGKKHWRLPSAMFIVHGLALSQHVIDEYRIVIG
jgi:hypothetical protein